MGTSADDESAHSNPFLIVFGGDTEAIYAVAVPDKSCRPWVVEYLYMIIAELGYDGVRNAIKCGGAPELKEIRKLVSAKRSQPTVPLDVPVRESKGNGAVERAYAHGLGNFGHSRAMLSLRSVKKLIRNIRCCNGWLGGLRPCCAEYRSSLMVVQFMNM